MFLCARELMNSGKPPYVRVPSGPWFRASTKKTADAAQEAARSAREARVAYNKAERHSTLSRSKACGSKYSGRRLGAAIRSHWTRTTSGTCLGRMPRSIGQTVTPALVIKLGSYYLYERMLRHPDEASLVDPRAQRGGARWTSVRISLRRSRMPVASAMRLVRSRASASTGTCCGWLECRRHTHLWSRRRLVPWFCRPGAELRRDCSCGAAVSCDHGAGWQRGRLGPF
jgi:hypothetical protein